MKKQELNNKSDTEKKGQVLRGSSAQRGSESSGLKLEDYFKQISVESSPESFTSILSSPEFSHPVNASQKVNIISHIQRIYGNKYLKSMIQAKLKISKSNDKYEQEADEVAETVMRMPELQVRRRLEEEEQLIHAKELSGKTPEVTSNLESRINSIRGGGQPLPKSERTFFEPRFGHDFSQVRIHTNERAADIARILNAQALTLGSDIVLAKDQYQPATAVGKNLLAHELAHVLQQRQEPSVFGPSHNLVQMRESKRFPRIRGPKPTHIEFPLQEIKGKPSKHGLEQRDIRIIFHDWRDRKGSGYSVEARFIGDVTLPPPSKGVPEYEEVKELFTIQYSGFTDVDGSLILLNKWLPPSGNVNLKVIDKEHHLPLERTVMYDTPESKKDSLDFNLLQDSDQFGIQAKSWERAEKTLSHRGKLGVDFAIIEGGYTATKEKGEEKGISLVARWIVIVPTKKLLVNEKRTPEVVH